MTWVEAPSAERLSMPRLAIDMVRYRVAAMMWLFMLIAAAFHGIASWPLDELAALTLALAASYVSATTVNDISDEPIDKINHPQGRGRPLVHGQATVADLWRLNAVAAAVALAAGAYVGWRGVAVVLVSLAIGYGYSVPPLLISHRTYSAAPVLTVAYVIAPYLHGLALADAAPGREDVALAGGLCCLFMARILLKDFRDRAGDAAFGKATLLLRFGKEVVCAISLGFLVVGLVVVGCTLRSGLMASVIGVFGCAIVMQVAALRAAASSIREQVSIGIAARMGNGLLVSLLSWLLLSGQEAPASVRAGFVLALLSVYVAVYVALSRRPEDVLIGYKG